MADETICAGKRCCKCGEIKPLSEFYNLAKADDGKHYQCIVCTKAYAAANRDKSAARTARWRLRNPDRAAKSDKMNREKFSKERAEAAALWREKNKDHVKAYMEKYEADNREKRKAAKRARSQQDPEYGREKSKEWRKANPDKMLSMKHRYRARKRNSPGRYDDDERDALLVKQKFVCANPYCDADLSDKKFRTVDHIVALSRGGSNSIENIQWLCRPCNSRKTILDHAEWLNREAHRALRAA